MSLTIPDNYNRYKIIGIDPGLTKAGVSIIEIDYKTNLIVSITALTLVNNKLINNTGLDGEVQSERLIKLYKFKNALLNIFIQHNPLAVVCESSFFNPTMPTAYSALVEVIYTIQNAIVEYNSNIMFTMIEPLLIKKIIGAIKFNDKEEVRKAVMSNKIIMSVLLDNIESLDEHAIDAIAIGYAFLLNNKGV